MKIIRIRKIKSVRDLLVERHGILFIRKVNTFRALRGLTARASSSVSGCEKVEKPSDWWNKAASN